MRGSHRQLGITGWAALAIALACQVQASPADLVLRHGTVLTVDEQDRSVTAIAILDGKIQAVGTDADITKLVGPRTKVIDLAGRTVTPGMIDTHAHVLLGAAEALYKVNLTHASSVAEILALIRVRAEKTAPGEWVQGFGWNEGLIAEHRGPTLEELDAVTAGHPALLENVTHHYGMLNSAALSKAGVDASTASPPGGQIMHRADGTPTGILKDKAQDPVIAQIPGLTPQQYRASVQQLLDQMHAAGMTGVKDLSYPNELDAYAEFAKSPGLTAHVCPLMWAGSTLESAKDTLRAIRHARVETAAIPGRDLTVCGAKILLDGSSLGRTAWRYEDFEPDPRHPGPGGRGFALVEPGQYRQMVELFNAAGVPVGTHAIGDRAIDLVVDTYLEALQATPRVGLRHAIIHAHEPTAHAFEVMQVLQKKYDAGIPEVQAEFLYWLGDALPSVFGPERSQHLIPLATFTSLGLKFAGGSDFPVTPLEPRLGLYASVARQPVNGVYGPHPFGTAESVDIHVALRSYTIWAARQLFLEKETGSIEVGKWADLAVWAENPYAIPTSALKNMTCRMTFYKGRMVFARQ